ncbi:unnamed protein product [Phaedon cochleariae]|uniref:DUF4806 domain-containing protein n=1 Tax=Phaedon cochleariae TaxID=80249 RepID=A0A9N9X485_PHACE|nr:unnamed protein product [Phaedon cochleariae]
MTPEKSASLRIQSSAEHIESTPGTSVIKQNGPISAPYPKKTPPVMNPEKSASLRIQSCAENMEPTPETSVREQNGPIPATYPKKAQPEMTPEKAPSNSQVVSQHPTPNRILQIFSQKLQEACNNTASDVLESATRRKVVPRLRQSTYGEVLTTPEVLRKLEEAEEKKKVKGNVAKRPRKMEKSKEYERDDEDLPLITLINEKSSKLLKSVVYGEVKWDDLQEDTFILAKFTGIGKSSIQYKYVCVVQNEDEDDGEIAIVGLKSIDKTCSDFYINEMNVSYITIDEVAAILPKPMELLPPPATGRKGCQKRETAASAIVKLIKFQKELVPLQTALQGRPSSQPFLLAVGTNEAEDDTGSNGDWSHYTPGHLRKPRTTILRKLPQSSIEVGEDGLVSLNLEEVFRADMENTAHRALHTSSSAAESCPNTPIARHTYQSPNKRPALKPMNADEIDPKKHKPDKENSTRHQASRRRPIISQAKNEVLMSKRLEALAKVTSHTEEEHQIIMEIHHTNETCETELSKKKDQEVSSDIESSEASQEHVEDDTMMDNTIVAEEYLTKADLHPIIKNQKLIMKELFNIRTTLNGIDSKTSATIIPAVGISNKYRLPINDIEEMKKLNTILNDRGEQNLFMRNMVQVGEKNVQVCTYRILEKLLTAHLSMQMNWSGKNQNKFAIIKMKNLVLRIVESVCMTIKCTESEVETNIKNYLRTAKDRLRIRDKQKSRVGARSGDDNVYQRRTEQLQEVTCYSNNSNSSNNDDIPEDIVSPIANSTGLNSDH